MSYGLQLADDASQALHVLSPEVQEEVLDVLERVAVESANVAGSDASGTDAFIKQTLIHRTEEEATYVDLELSIDHSARMVVLDRLVAVVMRKHV